MHKFFQDHFTAKGIMRRNRNQVNATAIEYALIAAGISVAIIAVVQGLGPKLKSTFSSPPALSQSK